MAREGKPAPVPDIHGLAAWLRIYDTRSRRKVDFEPQDPGHVRLYVCGPTVYDDAHIGNARPVVVFDVLTRLLRRLYPQVTYVRNITDIDDKINARSKETGEPIDAITRRTTARFHEDVAALGALEPDVEPRATGHVNEMIAMIERLVADGHAYEAEGHVLFEVSSMADYGALSRFGRKALVAGARVEVAPYKRDAADFVLWKPSDADTPGWDSPWGYGRPGWHIECSAMSIRYLGSDFDIHGGGRDLVFPHHENEIAQSLCAHPGSIFSRYWMHNGHLMVEGEKMAKSAGNFYTVRDLRGEFPGEAVRLLLLQTHYRQPLDFTKSGLAEAKRMLDRYYGALRRAPVQRSAAKGADKTDALNTDADTDADTEAKANIGIDPVLEALADDLNTPLALSALHQHLDALNAELDKSGDSEGAAERLRTAAEPLGLLGKDPEAWFRWQPEEGAEESAAAGLDDDEIAALVAQRETARTDRDFAEADRIRDRLAEAGVLLEDGPDGTLWRRG